MTDFSEIRASLVSLDEGRTAGLIRQALDSGADPSEILNRGLIRAMDIVGTHMEDGEMFIPEVLMAAQAMSVGVDILKPLLGDGDKTKKGRVVIGTVQGDLHDIGKNLVGMMMESAGLTVYNLGVDITPEGFVAAVRAHDADILCLSALLTTTMSMMRQTVDLVVENGLRDQVKIMVGGAPVTADYAREIGADAFAPDAGAAARQAKAMIA